MLFMRLISLGRRGQLFLIFSSAIRQPQRNNFHVPFTGICTVLALRCTPRCIKDAGCSEEGVFLRQGDQAGLSVIFSSRLFFTSLEDTASFCFLHYTSKTLSRQLWLTHIYILLGRAWTHPKAFMRLFTSLCSSKAAESAQHTSLKGKKNLNKLK